MYRQMCLRVEVKNGHLQADGGKGCGSIYHCCGFAHSTLLV
jgi:hypothetical protein